MIKNEHISLTARVRCPADKMRVTRPRWFGHIKKRNSKYISRRMLGMVLPGRRGQGRPKKRLLDVVKADQQVGSVTC